MNFPERSKSKNYGLEQVAQVLLLWFLFCFILDLHFRINNFNFKTESSLFIRRFLGNSAPLLHLRSSVFLGIKAFVDWLVEKSASDFCFLSLYVSRQWRGPFSGNLTVRKWKLGIRGNHSLLFYSYYYYKEITKENLWTISDTENGPRAFFLTTP